MKGLGYLVCLVISYTLSACHQQSLSDVHVYDLQTEYRTDPVGIDLAQPRLSWKLKAKGNNRKQSAFQILVANDEHALKENKGNLWDTGRMESETSIQIPYKGSPLVSNQTVFWKVRVWDQKNQVSEWSTIQTWTMGLISPQEWKANWIGYDEAREDSSFKTKPWANNAKMKSEYRPTPPPYLRTVFVTPSSIKSALLHITALGHYQAYFNGKRVGQDYFNPGWTDYSKRIYYRSYDVSSLLNEGENAWGVILADGWFAGNVANKGQDYYGSKTRVLAQLHITYENGTVDTVVTNANWKASFGSIREADMQAGETYDARLELTDWSKPSYDDQAWKPVLVRDTNTAILQSHPSAAVQIVEEFEPKAIWSTTGGRIMVDMGQNFAGWARIKLTGEKGDTLSMRFAESLINDSTLYTRNLRSVRATDTYVFKGSQEETWEPSFTYHGYRYIEISGLKGVPSKSAITGVAIQSNLNRSGFFECSDSLIKQLYHNILWSQRSNFVDVPTDCPQRDERMGWTGDAQVFYNTAAYNMNISSFMTKWMQDIADGQDSLGRFPSTAPKVFLRIASGWGDGGVIIPWKQFQYYQDTLLLKKFYPHFEAWVNYLNENSKNYISSQWTYGDWQNVESETSKKLIATAYFKHCNDLISEMAGILEKPSDSLRYKELAQRIASSFNDTFLLSNGRLKDETQTGYLLALNFDLLEKEKQSSAFEYLLESIYKADTQLTTGILGTQFLLPTLSRFGQNNLAYQLIQSNTYPSWGYSIQHGATTVWERWNSFTKENGFYDDKTNSLNHYAYGAVGEWMYETIAGIRPLSPGFKTFEIKPIPGPLDSALAIYESIYGRISSKWHYENEDFVLDVEIPVNTVASVSLPFGSIENTMINGHSISALPPEFAVQVNIDSNAIEIGSGSYRFQIPKMNVE